MTILLERSAAALTPASQETLEKLALMQRALLSVEQIPIATEHILHGGMYARTIRLLPGVVMMGSLIKRPTLLIFNGYGSVLAGSERIDLAGYNVLPGCAGRKQLFVTGGPIELTMIFATNATTVEEAEDEVFAEADLLMSRKDSRGDTITITGE
jgi:hypothetical protein